MVYFGSKFRFRRGEKREKKDDYNDDEDGGKVCNWFFCFFSWFICILFYSLVLKD